MTSKYVAPHWPDRDGDGMPDPVMYNINLNRAENYIQGSDPLNAWQHSIYLSFKAWEDIQTSSISFYRGPNTSSVSPGGGDGENPVAFFPVGIPIGALAVTMPVADSETGEISEASILFNPNPMPGQGPDFSNDGSPGSLDLQAIVTHEAGHWIGLAHSAVRDDPDMESGDPSRAAVMFPFIRTDVVSNRILEQDDIAWAGELYPEASFNASTGDIMGRIIVGSVPGGIYGARGTHVVAREAASNVMIVGTYSRPEFGLYRIPGIPPGQYNVFVEPLDGPVSHLQVSALTQFTRYDDFPSAYYTAGQEVGDPGNVANSVAVNVQGGEISKGIDITIEPVGGVCGTIGPAGQPHPGQGVAAILLPVAVVAAFHRAMRRSRAR